MIRDPSDGTIKEKPEIEPAPVEDPIIAGIRTAILAGRVRPERLSDEWVFQRGWNDGIDFAVRQAAEWLKEWKGRNGT